MNVIVNGYFVFYDDGTPASPPLLHLFRCFDPPISHVVPPNFGCSANSFQRPAARTALHSPRFIAEPAPSSARTITGHSGRCPKSAQLWAVVAAAGGHCRPFPLPIVQHPSKHEAESKAALRNTPRRPTLRTTTCGFFGLRSRTPSTAATDIAQSVSRACKHVAYHSSCPLY